MRRHLLLLLLSVFSVAVFAQSKKPLDHTVYDGWQSITFPRISNNGQWAIYSVTPQEGDATVNITNLKTKSAIAVARGADARFTDDSKYAVFMIKPFFKDTRQARIKKKKPEDMPKDSLGIATIANGSVWKIGRVKSYRIPEKASNWVAYQLDTPLPDTTKKAASKEGGSTPPAAPAPSSKDGFDLVLRNLPNSTETTFKYTTDYQFSENGKYLVFVSNGAKKDSVNKAGVYVYDIEKSALKRISTGTGQYKSLTFDETASQLVFLAEKAPAKAKEKFYDLYYYTPSQDSATVLINKNSTGMPQGSSVSPDGRVSFSKNGQKLFFGTAPIPAPKDTTIIDFEVAKVDIWNYKDDYLQPMQLRNLDRDLKRSFSAVTYPAGSRSVIQLADEKVPDVIVGNEGDSEYALASTDFGMRVESQWTGSTNRDVYLVSTVDGTRKKIASAVRGFSSLSPMGKYVAWYNRADKNWYSYNVATGKQVKLNEGMNIMFYDEDNDVPDDPNAYGVAGWSADDKNVLIYDRYDIWSFNPDGGTPKNLTNGQGRANKITFRYIRQNPEERWINLKESQLLSAFNTINKYDGWYRKNFSDNKNPVEIISGPYNYSAPIKARDANMYVFQKSNYQLSPNIYATADLKTESRLSNSNPQQGSYNWGTAELVKWTTFKGKSSEGILYKPEDFDATKKYPMIVYFYEKSSDGLYNYEPPAPTGSRLNIPFFVSNGYLVFVPDVSYEIGYPGESAMDFINSGVESLKKNTWVDGSKIGLQGQSWGGYQIAYMITKTDMYAAAWAGAPVANMTSAYGGIRWESGMNRQFQYEKTQSRIGATLWEKPQLYIENSPLFYLPNVKTPVAIMSNDADGAVPWYQGIEMFTGLRRLGKPVWLLNYNGEAHNLVQRQNKKDIQIREQQFFDHFLKGKPMPVWMDRGVPATEKGRNWGFELVDDKK